MGRILLLLAALAAALAQARAAPLDAESCAKLMNEHGQLEQAGVEADMAKGPEWAKANLLPEKLERIRRFIEIEEQLLFRCRQKSLVSLPPEVEAAPAATTRSRTRTRTRTRTRRRRRRPTRPRRRPQRPRRARDPRRRRRCSRRPSGRPSSRSRRRAPPSPRPKPKRRRSSRPGPRPSLRRPRRRRSAPRKRRLRGLVRSPAKAGTKVLRGGLEPLATRPQLV